MSRDDSSSGFSFFLLGAAVGAVLGVLFAPKSGEETREELSDWLSQRRRKGADFVGRLKEDLPSRREAAAAAVRAGRKALREALGDKPAPEET